MRLWSITRTSRSAWIKGMCTWPVACWSWGQFVLHSRHKTCPSSSLSSNAGIIQSLLLCLLLEERAAMPFSIVIATPAGWYLGGSRHWCREEWTIRLPGCHIDRQTVVSGGLWAGDDGSWLTLTFISPKAFQASLSVSSRPSVGRDRFVVWGLACMIIAKFLSTCSTCLLLRPQHFKPSN